MQRLQLLLLSSAFYPEVFEALGQVGAGSVNFPNLVVLVFDLLAKSGDLAAQLINLVVSVQHHVPLVLKLPPKVNLSLGRVIETHIHQTN